MILAAILATQTEPLGSPTLISVLLEHRQSCRRQCGKACAKWLLPHGYVPRALPP